ncbi:relaxase/mobilization nuclease domain-containing protein (plasmid) [Nodosilinea sp. E11]|nr:relaxase/mobilization nuclease domain-containing protein [Nodosilinea sp. E11]WOD37264.1 relaxase/mobilization nuclease domain-containing protein [Nodosilinea sp. E11]
MAWSDPKDLAREFNWVVSRPRDRQVKQTMAHLMVSLPPSEHVDTHQIALISLKILDSMGHGGCPFFVTEHHDKEAVNGVQHWHIATSAIDLEGNRVNDSFSRLRLQRLARQLEQEMGLMPLDVAPDSQRRNLSTGECRRKERTGETLPKETIWDEIDCATHDNPTMAMLVTRLKARGVEVHLRKASNPGDGPAFIGISYAVDGHSFSGRRLGPAYSINGLQKHRQVEYRPDQDEALAQLMAMNQAQCQQLLTDYEAFQQLWKEHYAHYSKVAQGGSGEPQGRQLDADVARLAASEEESIFSVVGILRQGPVAQALRRNQGHYAALEYCQEIAHQLTHCQSEPELQLTQKALEIEL